MAKKNKNFHLMCVKIEKRLLFLGIIYDKIKKVIQLEMVSDCITFFHKPALLRMVSGETEGIRESREDLFNERTVIRQNKKD